MIWEGYGPDSNRKFSFDPYDVVVDVNELGHLECLYISKIGHFRDPRGKKKKKDNRGKENRSH